MPSEPTLTLAVPYHRGLDYLARALRSIQAQRSSGWTAVVVDDRGGDDAAAMVHALGDDRIAYVRNLDAPGIAGNWNCALAHAKTELVTLVHADDELEPDYVGQMLALMSRHPDAVAGHCRARIIGPSGRPAFSLPDEVKKVIRPAWTTDLVTEGEQGLLSIVRGDWIFCPTLCYRRSRLPAGGFASGWQCVLDVDLMARILFAGGALVGTPQVGYRYRRHAANQTAVKTESLLRFHEELAHLDDVAVQAERVGWARVARCARRRTMVRLHLLEQALRAAAGRRWERAGPLVRGAITGRL